MTNSIAKYGNPSGDAPASYTRAMLGWSISASACRSASKRATTCALSMPGRTTLSATRRLTGVSCSARKTQPMPPSPMTEISLYGPITPPGPTNFRIAMPSTGINVGGVSRNETPALLSASSKRWTRARNATLPAHALSKTAARSAGDAAALALSKSSNNSVSAPMPVPQNTTAAVSPHETVQRRARNPAASQHRAAHVSKRPKNRVILNTYAKFSAGDWHENVKNM